MSPAELTEGLSKRLCIDRDLSNRFLTEFIDLVKNNLSAGRTVRLPGLGRLVPMFAGDRVKLNANFCKEPPYIPPHVRVRLIQYDSCKLELYEENKELWDACRDHVSSSKC